MSEAFAPTAEHVAAFSAALHYILWSGCREKSLRHRGGRHKARTRTSRLRFFPGDGEARSADSDAQAVGGAMQRMSRIS